MKHKISLQNLPQLVFRTLFLFNVLRSVLDFIRHNINSSSITVFILVIRTFFTKIHYFRIVQIIIFLFTALFLPDHILTFVHTRNLIASNFSQRLDCIFLRLS